MRKKGFWPTNNAKDANAETLFASLVPFVGSFFLLSKRTREPAGRISESLTKRPTEAPCPIQSL